MQFIKKIIMIIVIALAIPCTTTLQASKNNATQKITATKNVPTSKKATHGLKVQDLQQRFMNKNEKLQRLDTQITLNDAKLADPSLGKSSAINGIKTNINVLNLKTQNIQESIASSAGNIKTLTKNMEQLQNTLTAAQKSLDALKKPSSFSLFNTKEQNEAVKQVATATKALNKAKKDLDAATKDYSKELSRLDETTTIIAKAKKQLINSQRARIERNQARNAPQVSMMQQAYYNVLDVVATLQIHASTKAALKKPISSIFRLLSARKSTDPTPAEIAAIKKQATKEVTTQLQSIVDILQNDKGSINPVLTSIQAEAEGILSFAGSAGANVAQVAGTAVVVAAVVVGTVAVVLIAANGGGVPAYYGSGPSFSTNPAPKIRNLQKAPRTKVLESNNNLQEFLEK